MTRPGALESKKRCHDLIHSERDEVDILRKSTHFSEDLKHRFSKEDENRPQR
jgi:hypothetical protein